MKPIGEPIRRVHGGTAGGSLAWSGDGSGFWYTRYPRAGERPAADLAFYQQVWFHRLGQAESTDRKELGDELPRIAEVELHARRDGKWVLALVKNGDGGEAELWLRQAGKAPWKRLSRFADLAVGAEFGDGPDLYVLSRKGAPGARSCTSRSRPRAPTRSAAPGCWSRREATRSRGSWRSVTGSTSRRWPEVRRACAWSPGAGKRSAKSHPARLGRLPGRSAPGPRHPLPEHQLDRADRLVLLRPRDGTGGEDPARSGLARQSLRRGGGARMGRPRRTARECRWTSSG